MVANGTSSYRTRSTILFYPEERRRNRHIKLYERKGMSQLMPLVIENVDAQVHRCALVASSNFVLSPQPLFIACQVHLVELRKV